MIVALELEADDLELCRGHVHRALDDLAVWSFESDLVLAGFDEGLEGDAGLLDGTDGGTGPSGLGDLELAQSGLQLPELLSGLLGLCSGEARELQRLGVAVGRPSAVFGALPTHGRVVERGAVGGALVRFGEGLGADAELAFLGGCDAGFEELRRDSGLRAVLGAGGGRKGEHGDNRAQRCSCDRRKHCVRLAWRVAGQTRRSERPTRTSLCEPWR